MFDAILAQVKKFNFMGPVEYLQSNLVTGIKHMPLRHRRAEAVRSDGQRTVRFTYAGLWQTASMLLPSGSWTNAP